MPRIGNHNAEGPINRNSESNLPEVSGVYVVRGPNQRMIDVGETHNIRQRIANHERKSCWIREGYTEFLVIRAPESRRKVIERELRNGRNLPCGDV